MNAKHAESELVDEMTRYLATVELFRSLGCEPRWQPEIRRPAPVTEPSCSTEVARRTY